MRGSTTTYRDGVEYDGSWVDDKKHGEGTYTYVGGRKYVGRWLYGYECSSIEDSGED